jgi:hypothetical protein
VSFKGFARTRCAMGDAFQHQFDDKSQSKFNTRSWQRRIRGPQERHEPCDTSRPPINLELWVEVVVCMQAVNQAQIATTVLAPLGDHVDQWNQ